MLADTNFFDVAVAALAVAGPILLGSLGFKVARTQKARTQEVQRHIATGNGHTLGEGIAAMEVTLGAIGQKVDRMEQGTEHIVRWIERHDLEHIIADARSIGGSA